MSYGVVRVQKMTAGSVAGIEIHDLRKKEISHTNPDIDYNRSVLNYDLHEHPPGLDGLSYRSLVNERIGELQLSKAVRKDAIVMAQVLVTSDSFFFNNLQYHDATRNFDSELMRVSGNQDSIRKFFEDSYHFMCDRYGKENVISATVHMDERTPHMHFNFVPVTKDGRLSAKDIFTKISLTEQQTAFHENVGAKWELLRGEPKDSGKRRKHYETQEFKSAMKEVADVRSEASELRQTASERQERVLDLENHAKRIQGVKIAVEGEISELQKKKGEVQRELAIATTALNQTHAIGHGKFTKDNWLDQVDNIREQKRKDERLSLLEKFIELPAIKPLFEKFMQMMTPQRGRSTRSSDDRER